MKNLSLKMDELLFDEMEQVLKKVRMSRNRYITEAVIFYNKVKQRQLLAKQLRKESRLVSDSSLQDLW